MNCPECGIPIDLEKVELGPEDRSAFRKRLGREQHAGKSSEERSAAAKKAAAGRWGKTVEAPGVPDVVEAPAGQVDVAPVLEREAAVSRVKSAPVTEWEPPISPVRGHAVTDSGGAGSKKPPVAYCEACGCPGGRRRDGCRRRGECFCHTAAAGAVVRR